MTAAAGIYLHTPFCSAICPYCDFAVKVGSTGERAAFTATLLREIELAAADPLRRAAGAGADTIYFGGGTPSLLAVEELERIVAALGAALPLAPEPEIFLEVNPEDVTADRLVAWRRLGVGFLSLGVQALDERELAFLGRRHTPEAARRAVELARAAGFDAGDTTVSIDLIYGLPGQDAAAWERTLAAAVALAPDHLSCYELEVHERTTFGKRRARGELAELPETTQAELFLLTHRFLADAGYPAYEVSNFACCTTVQRPAHRSRHNQKYWHHVPYLGLGPSAHSFAGRRRFWNERQLARWARRIDAGEPAEAGGEELSDDDLALEALMLGLRTSEGVAVADFAARYGRDLLGPNRERIARLVDEGVVAVEGGRLRATCAGLAVADALAASFVIA